MVKYRIVKVKKKKNENNNKYNKLARKINKNK